MQRGRERLFHASLSITLHAKDEASLKEMTQRAKSHFAATLGKLDPLAFRQREGLLSTLPLALNAVAEWRSLDTSSIARLFPFSPPDLDTRSGTLYGIDMRACSPVDTIQHSLEQPSRNRHLGQLKDQSTGVPHQTTSHLDQLDLHAPQRPVPDRLGQT